VGVGLSILVDGCVTSVGATTPAAQQMDAGQATDGTGPCLHALDTGDVVSVADYSIDIRWPGTSHRAAESGVRSSLSLPLSAEGDLVLGALNVYSDFPDAFSAEIMSSLEAFAAQATTSLVFLGEMQDQRDDSAYVTAFSDTVQHSLRAVLPEVTGLELVGGSVPASAQAKVGGDWYDALLLPDDKVGLVIGDVMGHDIKAVSAMAQLRTMVRAGAWLGARPDHVLAMADELTALAAMVETATLFYGRLTRTTAASPAGAVAELEYCNAGHLHPLVRNPDGTVTVLDGGSRMLLGALGTGAPAQDSHVAHASLPAGTILLLYSDGLIEHPDVTMEEATDQLVQTLADHDPSTPLTELCRRLLTAATARDDTTVFAIRVL
jgi:serine phosphatase RsbU (regulator of sigma subunit)